MATNTKATTTTTTTTTNTKVQATPVQAPAQAPASAPAATPVQAGRGVPLQAIKLLVPTNPKRPNTACWVRAQAYWPAYAAAGATTATAMQAGATAADLKWDQAHGFIALLPVK